MRALRNFKSNRCYHLISRIANRAFFLTEEERSRFVARMWRVAEFSGIGVLAYCFMGNHFHLLVYLPEARKLDDGELFDRIASLYQGVRLSEIRQEWDMCVRTGDEPGKQSFRERFFRRMYDVSAFMKTLKQNSTMSYNSHIVPWEQIREMHEKSIHLVLRELEEEKLSGPARKGLSVDEEKSQKVRRKAFERFAQSISVSVPRLLEKGSNKVAFDLLKLLADGPRRPAELRAALSVSSANFFTSRYLTPLATAGYIAAVDAENPHSPQRRYCLAAKGRKVLT